MTATLVVDVTPLSLRLDPRDRRRLAELLLDEMSSPTLAEQLAARGHDVGAIKVGAEFCGVPDYDVFVMAQLGRGGRQLRHLAARRRRPRGWSSRASGVNAAMYANSPLTSGTCLGWRAARALHWSCAGGRAVAPRPPSRALRSA